MSVDLIVSRTQPRLAELAAELDGMMTRLKTLVGSAGFDDRAMGELAAIYNNVAYLFLYLESNAAHVAFDELKPWKTAFYADPELDELVLRRLERLRCEDPDAETAREAYVGFFRQRLADGACPDDAEIEALRARLSSIDAELRRDRGELLGRLTHTGASLTPEAHYYNLVRRQPDPSVRSKLARAWDRPRKARRASHARAVDDLVRARRARSRAHGFESARQETFARCGVTIDEARFFLDRYLSSALESQKRLNSEVRTLVGPCDRPMDHFEFFVRQVQGEDEIPLFVLDDCLDFLFAIAGRMFDLAFDRVSRGFDHVISVDVLQGGRLCGQINFDLWDHDAAPKSANHTFGARNRMNWGGIEQQPVAYVSCRFRTQTGTDGRITFQNMHSLFHEFGHAINHLLIRRRFPTESGLDYLPLERLETLSMWFERWVFHPSLARRLPLSDAERRGLLTAQRIKGLEYRRTHVDRAMTAVLDFAVNGAEHPGVEEVFASLDARYDLSWACDLDDFLPYFNLPMLEANPGGYFSYLWGAAESAERFLPLMRLDVDALPVAATTLASLEACFDFDATSVEPTVEAAIAFYEPDLIMHAGART